MIVSSMFNRIFQPTFYARLPVHQITPCKFHQYPLVVRHLLHHRQRMFSDRSNKQTIHPAEARIRDILSKKFPSAEYIEVTDVSGGCGAMYEISVVAGEFKGLTMVKQHRLVNEALKEEIKDMHGLRIHTALPTKPS